MALTPVKVFENTAYVEFLGKLVPSNTTQTFGANPPEVEKTVDIIYVEGSTATLSYVAKIRNRAGFPVKFPFKDPISQGGEYVAGSFKVNNEVVEPILDADTIYYSLPELDPGRAVKVEFQITAAFEMFEGQDDN